MKMPDKLDKSLIAPCGVNCLACSAYLNSKNSCPGCRAPLEEQKRKSCQSCAKKRCAFEQGLNWCFECGRFPCSRVKSLGKRYQENYDVDLIQNGLDARADMDAFLESQRERFSCEACGSIIDQHHKKCSDCGHEE